MSLRTLCAALVSGLLLACSSGGGATTGATGSTGSIGGTSGTGSTGGASSTSGLPAFGDGGCSNELRSTELFTCHANAGCACPQVCHLDPGAGTTLCELPCATSADCPSAATACLNGYCALNFCNQNLLDGGAPSHFGAACGVSSLTAMDGTCIPSFDGHGYASIGFCIENGTATAQCNLDTPDNPFGPPQGITMPGTPRYPPSDYCGPGFACAGSGTCEAFCDPVHGGCGSGQTCVAQDPLNRSWGLCGPCIQSGQSCILASDCCSLSCDLQNGCAGGCDPSQGC